MASFGEWLKSQREARNRTIEEIGSATGIHQGYLEALETNEFSALPGPAFGKLYIRAYAETLGMDPGLLMEQYDREQAERARSAPRPPAPEPPRSRHIKAVVSEWRAARIAAWEKASRAGAPEINGTEGWEEPATQAAPQPAPQAAPPEAAPPEVEPSQPPTESPVSAVVEEAVQPARSNRRAVVAALISCGVLVIAAGAWRIAFRSPPRGAVVSPPASTAPSAPKAPEGSKLANPAASYAGEGNLRPELPPVRSHPATGAGATAGTSPITVPEFDLGRRIVGRRVEGRDEPFAVGEEVLFSTHVIGGQAGDTIRHVWIHEGRAVQSIGLRLGGPDWRTHSRKTLRHAGAWTVEARDAQGRVLATAVLTAAPAAR